MQECNQCNGYNAKGNREGYWEEYHSNGNLSFKGYFKDGEPDGYWEEYHLDGSLDEKCFYARM